MNCDVESHKMHMCYLKANGKDECIRTVSDNPVVQCRQCGAMANDARYLCAAHLKEDAPNVEGGHGSIGPEEVGKTHSG